jgi:hypothetical protein
MLSGPVRRALARLGAVAVMTTAGAGLVVPPAHALPWTVSLSASKTSAVPGEPVTLTATARDDVWPTPYYIEIYDTATGAVVGSPCGSGYTCSASVSNFGGTHTYQAYVAYYSSTAPPSGIQATSNPVTVTWGLNSPCQSTSGVVACLSPTSEITRVFVYEPTLVPGSSVHVYGYVDLYRFTLPTTTVTLPCVVAPGVNPCASAGGTYVSRVATLVDTYVNVPSVALVPLTSVGVCNASLTLTVDGIGINAAPAITVC